MVRYETAKAAAITLIMALAPAGPAQEGAPAAGAPPLLTLRVQDVAPYLRRAAAAPVVREALYVLTVRLGVEPFADEFLDAQTRLIAGYLPRRVDMTLAQSVAMAGAAMYEIASLDDCFALLRQRGAAGVDGDRIHRLLEKRLVAALEASARLDLRVEMTWPEEATSRRAFDWLIGWLKTAVDGSRLRGIVTTTARGAGDEDALAFTLDPQALREATVIEDRLRSMGVSEPSADLVRDVRSVLQSVGLELVVRRRADVLVIEVKSAPGAVLEALPQATDMPLVVGRWSVSSRVRAALQDTDRLVDEFAQQETPERLRGASSAVLPGRQSPPALEGQVRLEVADDGSLTIEAVTPNTGPPVELATSGLLQHVPRDVELWAASGRDTVVEHLQAWCQWWMGLIAKQAETIRLDPMTEQSRQQLEGIQREALRVCDSLDELADGFEPGAAAFVTASGRVGTGSMRLPAVTVLARPKTADDGLRLARRLFEPVAKAAGMELSQGRDSVALVVPDGHPIAGPGFCLQAFLREGVLVLSTSREARRFVEEGGGHVPLPDGCVTAVHTTGRRLADLTSAYASLLRVIARDRPGAKRRSLERLLGAARVALHLVGSVSVVTTTEGQDQRTRCLVRLSAQEAEQLSELLSRSATAAGVLELPAERMLVGQGEGRFYGQDATFRFSYGPRNEFRLEIRSACGFDSAWDGSRFVQDEGWGFWPCHPDLAAGERAWALAIAGLWPVAPGFDRRLLDMSTDGPSVALVAPESRLGGRIVVDPRSSLARRVDIAVEQPLGFERGRTLLADYRRVEGRLLPHSISVPELGNEYRVRAWQMQPLDRSRFSPKVQSRVAVATERLPLRLVATDDQLLVEGSVAGVEGWFVLRPLWSYCVLNASIGARFVVPGAPIWLPVKADVSIGPLSARQVPFLVAPMPELPNRKLLGHVGSPILTSCCVRFHLRRRILELLPAGSWTGDGFQPMSHASGHPVFTCALPGGGQTWMAPLDLKEAGALAILKPTLTDQLAALTRATGAPLVNGHLPWVQLPGKRVDLKWVLHAILADALTEDVTPMALVFETFADCVLEMDFPNERYRLVPAK